MTRAAIQGQRSAAGQMPALPDLRRPLLTGAAVVLALLIGFGLWGAVAPLSSAALAPGMVAVDSKRKTVQHLEGGIVSRILVQEGQRVRAGQPLVRLDTTQAEASWNVASGQLRSERALEARLVAERDGAQEIAFPADLMAPGGEVLDAQRRIFAARAAALTGQRQILTERVGQLESEIEGLRAQEVAALDQRRLIGDELADVGSLVEQGLELMPRLRSLERTRAELDGRIGQFRGEIARARQAIGETRLEMIDLDNRRAEEVVGELRDVQRTIADLREQVRAAEDVLSRRDVLAPVDGSIVNLATVTPGGVVTPGDALMEIVPEDDRLTVSARLRPTDIDSVHAGLPAEVRLTAFKAWSTPTLRGTVTYVSADVLTDQNTGETYYDLRVEVDRAEVERLPDVSLYPGMPVQTTVVVGERPFLEYLIQPILDSFSRAFREQ
jgi:HlyD family secretion protein/epimerase transport system membrane fusion protein